MPVQAIPLALIASLYPLGLAAVLVLAEAMRPRPKVGVFLIGALVCTMAIGFVVVFALHGMGPNSSQSHLTSTFMRRAVARFKGEPLPPDAGDVPGLASDGKHPYVFFIEERSLLVRLILLRRRVPGVLEVATPELDGMTGLLRGDIDPGLGDDRVLICSNDHDAIPPCRPLSLPRLGIP